MMQCMSSPLSTLTDPDAIEPASASPLLSKASATAHITTRSAMLLPSRHFGQ
jgi:hypothetical protein